jgi:16S rRNA (uracil1498-N3)-methyltransferase
MQIRLFHSPLAQGPCRLSEEASHHLVRVLRAEEGHAVVLFDGLGNEAGARVLEANAKACMVEVGAVKTVSRESPLQITVVQALCLGDKMDWVVQKASELGATLIQPLAAQRSQMKLEGPRLEKRLAHWRAIAEAAAAQCGRNAVPIIAPLQRSAEYFSSIENSEDSKGGKGGERSEHLDQRKQTRWILDPFASESLGQAPLSNSLTIAIGPEAGWTDEEEEQAQRAGFVGIRCGPRILRTETAAAAVLAAVAVRIGEF